MMPATVPDSALLAGAKDEVGISSVEVSVVADDERVAVDGDRHLRDAADELRDRGSRGGERFGAAVDDYDLAVATARHAAAQEAAVVRFVTHDPGEARWRVVPVAVAGVVQASVGRDPEYELRIGVSELPDVAAAAGIARRQELPLLGGCFSRDGTYSNHFDARSGTRAGEVRVFVFLQGAISRNSLQEYEMPSVVGTKGQVTIEKSIRDTLGVEPGWRAIQQLEGDRVVIQFRPPKHRRSLLGMLSGPDVPQLDEEAFRSAVERAWDEQAPAAEPRETDERE